MNPLLSFALDWVRINGGLWEEERPGLIRVVPGRAPAGAGELSLVTDDPEIARERPDARLVAPASRLFEAMVEDGLARGRLAVAHLAGLRWTEPRVLGGIASAMRFGDARCEVASMRAAEYRTALFRFLAAFESDEIEKERVEVCVNQNNGRMARRVPDAAARAPRADAPAERLPRAPGRPAAEIFRTAWEEAVAKTAASRRSRLASVEARKAAERSRAERYFEDLVRETEEDAAAAHDPSRRDALRARGASIVAERSRALGEIDARHRLSMKLDVGSILVLAQPKVEIACTLIHKKGWKAALGLVWDPLLEEIEPPDCPSCRRPGTSFEVTRGGIVCAPNCRAIPP